MNDSLILKQVRIQLENRCLVGVDQIIPPGEVFTVMGPSGSGKSTLLAYVAGFLSPTFQAEGEIWLGNRDITHLPAESRGVGLLFQDPLLFPHLSVAGNLGFGLPQRTPNKAECIERALEQINLSGFGNRDPATLSGGQKSRVALMRLLLSKPCAVLLDEPFSKLDTTLRREMRDLVFSQLREAGLPSLLVTHDQEDAQAAGGPLIEL
ncbi:ATP-binding cassette domain-containing protein [Halomonas sediminis]